MANRTPLAEIFWVTAAISPLSVETTTGSANGNLTAQRTSCRGVTCVGPTIESANGGFAAVIECTLDQNPVPYYFTRLFLCSPRRECAGRGNLLRNPRHAMIHGGKIGAPLRGEAHFSCLHVAHREYTVAGHASPGDRPRPGGKKSRHLGQYVP